MGEQVTLAVGDMCGPARKNPGAEATAALARRARPRTSNTSATARFDRFGLLKLTLSPFRYERAFVGVDDRVIDQGAQKVNAYTDGALSEGLASAGTRQEADACAAYAATLDEIAGNGECCPVNADGKVDVEQTSFVLEGIRDGLDNATLIWMKEPHSCSATLNA